MAFRDIVGIGVNDDVYLSETESSYRFEHRLQILDAILHIVESNMEQQP